jgi:leucyl-tRNA synthetase
MMPHLAEEMSARLGGIGAPAGRGMLVADLPWPQADPALVAVDRVVIAVQVMGKLRGTVEAPPGATADEVIPLAEAEPNVQRVLAGKRIVKRVHVRDRIVNFVIAE